MKLSDCHQPMQKSKWPSENEDIVMVCRDHHKVGATPLSAADSCLSASQGTSAPISPVGPHFMRGDGVWHRPMGHVRIRHPARHTGTEPSHDTGDRAPSWPSASWVRALHAPVDDGLSIHSDGRSDHGPVREGLGPWASGCTPLTTWLKRSGFCWVPPPLRCSSESGPWWRLSDPGERDRVEAGPFCGWRLTQ
jgi:hypothetical protein